jgi:hypothetical protein
MPSHPRDPAASWFGRVDPSTAGDGASPNDAPWPTTQVDVADGVPGPQDSLSFLRTYRTFLSARALLAVVLLALLAGNWLMGNRSPIWVVTAVGYASLALLLWAWPSTRASQRTPHPLGPTTLSPRQAILSIGLDLAFFSLLQHLMNTAINTQALLALPVLMAGVLMPRLVALAVAAVASINLLAAAWIQGSLTSNLSAQLTEAGLTGFGLFMITLLAGELASRLAREELAARGSLELARQQAQLNRLVMEEMSRRRARRGPSRLHVRTANPAARAPAECSQGLTPAGARFTLQWCAGLGGVAAGGRQRGERAAARGDGPGSAAAFRRWQPPRPARAGALHAGPQGHPGRRHVHAVAGRPAHRAGPPSGRTSWRRWAACPPASHTRSATRWPPFRRPMR